MNTYEHLPQPHLYLSLSLPLAVLMRGFLSGLYHLPSTDLGTDLLAHSVGGVVPKRFPVIMDILLMPVMAVAQRAFRVFADGVVRKHRRGGK